PQRPRLADANVKIIFELPSSGLSDQNRNLQLPRDFRQRIRQGSLEMLQIERLAEGLFHGMPGRFRLMGQQRAGLQRVGSGGERNDLLEEPGDLPMRPL